MSIEFKFYWNTCVCIVQNGHQKLKKMSNIYLIYWIEKFKSLTFNLGKRKQKKKKKKTTMKKKKKKEENNKKLT